MCPDCRDTSQYSVCCCVELISADVLCCTAVPRLFAEIKAAFSSWEHMSALLCKKHSSHPPISAPRVVAPKEMFHERRKEMQKNASSFCASSLRGQAEPLHSGSSACPYWLSYSFLTERSKACCTASTRATTSSAASSKCFRYQSYNSMNPVWLCNKYTVFL